VATYTTKRNVAYPDEDSAEECLPIRAVFLLNEAGCSDVAIERVGASAACMAFVEHSFWMNPTDMVRTKQRVTKASALAVSVPVFQIFYPREYSALPAVRDAIIAGLS